ncbi:MAG TPA: hypothetical protein ENJ75_01570, partial [Candidatus Kaiserbacteria bacterium]|nr:hypothetical protein [Candidatus Kaiserbacteria bacterium]
MNKIIKYLFIISALFFLSLFANTTVFAGTGNTVSGGAVNTVSASNTGANNSFRWNNISQELHSAQDALHDKITASLNTVSKNSFQLTSFPQEPASVAYVLNGEMLSDWGKTVFSVYKPTLSLINKTQESFIKTINGVYTASSNKISKWSTLPKEPASVAYVLNGEMLSDWGKTAVWAYHSVLSLFNKKADNVFVKNDNVGDTSSSLSIISSASTSPSTKEPKSVAVKTTTGNTTIINPIKERVVEKTIVKTVSGVSHVDLQNVSNKLHAEISRLAHTVATKKPQYRAIVLSNKVKNVDAATISNSTITGSIISGSTFSGSTLSLAGALTGATGSFSGDLSTAGRLIVSGVATSTISGNVAFDTDTLYVDSLNNRVGIGTSSPVDTLSVNGATYLAPITPTNTTSRLYNSSGNLYWSGNLIGGATTGSWDTDGTSVWRPSGNVGIGTTSPYAKLSVVGQTVSSYFTAASTVATSTFPYLSATQSNVGTVVAGTWKGASIGDAYIDDTITASNYLPLSDWFATTTAPQLTTLANLTTTGVLNSGSISSGFGAINNGASNITTTGTGTFGNVGIGTTSPATTLSVAGSEYLTGSIGIGTASPTQALDINHGNINMSQEPAPSAPTVAVNATAGNLTGDYVYRITFVTADGETGMGAYSAVVSPSAEEVDLTNIPTGSSKVTARKIYRTVANGTYPYNAQYVATISDNTTTTYTDNLADSSLGAYAPGNNTTGSALYTNGTKSGEADSGVTIFGYNAGRVNAGSYNSFVGTSAGQFNTTGYNNSFVGYAAGQFNTTGYNNTFVGRSAGNINTTGSSNTFVGRSAGNNNTTGSNNSFVGRNTGYSNTTGSNNTAQGYNAGRFIADGTTANTTGSNNSFLGYNTKALADGDTNETVIGYNATGIGSNSVVLGNDSVLTTVLKGNVGIGTTSPATTLSVAGSEYLTGSIGIGTASPTQSLDINHGNINMSQEPAPSAPTVAVNTTAGNLTGDYVYRITFVTADGETSMGSYSATVSPNAEEVDLTNIPTGSSKVTARKIYRTVANGGY